MCKLTSEQESMIGDDAYHEKQLEEEDNREKTELGKLYISDYREDLGRVSKGTRQKLFCLDCAVRADCIGWNECEYKLKALEEINKWKMKRKVNAG